MKTLYYPAKIWIAFGEAVGGNEGISQWLMKNGFAEVAALAYAIRGSEDATEWLFQNKFYHLSALDAAIDENMDAHAWLVKFKHPFLVFFAEACCGKESAFTWFRTNQLEFFVLIAMKIKHLRDNTTFDHHKKNF